MRAQDADTSEPDEDTLGPDVVIPEALAVYLAERFIVTDVLDDVALDALQSYITAAHNDGDR